MARSPFPRLFPTCRSMPAGSPSVVVAASRLARDVIAAALPTVLGDVRVEAASQYIRPIRFAYIPARYSDMPPLITLAKLLDVVATSLRGVFLGCGGSAAY